MIFIYFINPTIGQQTLYSYWLLRHWIGCDIHWRIPILAEAIAEVNIGILQWISHPIQWLNCQQSFAFLTNEQTDKHFPEYSFSRDVLILSTHIQCEPVTSKIFVELKKVSASETQTISRLYNSLLCLRCRFWRRRNRVACLPGYSWCCGDVDWLRWGLTTCQLLWAILCRLPVKGKS